MRLVCPNCSAQYEIDGSMIPSEGRDVQCSNCGHTWFELPGPSTEPERSARSLADDDPDDFGTSEFDPEEEDAFDESAEETLSSRVETRPTNLSREEFEDLSADDFASRSGPDVSDESGEEEDESDPEDSEDDSISAMAAIASAAEDSDEEYYSGDGEPQAEPDEPPKVDDEAEFDDDLDRDTKFDEVDDDDDDDDELAHIPVAPPTGTARRPADMAALDILREEAQREMSQRRAPPSEPLETQTDLGLDDIRNRRTPSRALRARMAHLGEDYPEDDEPDEEFPTEISDRKTRLMPSSTPPAQDDEDGYEEPRRDLLPDIEEINSTLRKPPAGGRGSEARHRSGFRAGFLLMVLLAGAAIFAYAQAPAIARALPDTETSLISYVDWANGLRDKVDNLIGN